MLERNAVVKKTVESREGKTASLLLPLASARRRKFAAAQGNVLLLLLRWFQDLGLLVSMTYMLENIGVTYLERAEQALIYAHHGACIVKLAAVVGCTEERNELTLREELVTIFHDLVSTANEVHVVLLQEARNHVGAECERHATIVFAPASDVLVGVGPQQIAKETAIRDLNQSASYIKRWN